MSLESSIVTLLSSLAGGRIYPDTPPDAPTFPCITYQQVGGNSLWFSEKAKPSHKHARIQFNVWSRKRAEANQIARAIEDKFQTGTLDAEPFGELVALYDDKLKLYGTRQDFGIWFPD